MNLLRRVHLYVGALVAPFLLVTAVTAVVMLSGISHDALLFLRLHSWRIIERYLGVAVAVGLVVLAVTGGILYAQFRINQFRRLRAKRAAQKVAAG